LHTALQKKIPGVWAPAFAGATDAENFQNGLSSNPAASAGRGPGAAQ
jgi:hypothetical protein